jgi:hypothetical protein
MHFLNRREILDPGHISVSACFSVELRRGSYKILMDCSGVPDMQFAKLVLGAGMAWFAEPAELQEY